MEEDEERGIAHIIEHLGFSATKAYENHAIVNRVPNSVRNRDQPTPGQWDLIGEYV